MPKIVVQLHYKEEIIMAMDATLQIRMNSDLKAQVEELYKTYKFVCVTE